MAAAITAANCTIKKISPGPGEILTYLIITPSTADSADYIDFSGYVTDIKFLICWDESTGDIVTATESSATITIDASGGTTDHTYGILVIATR